MGLVLVLVLARVRTRVLAPAVLEVAAVVLAKSLEQLVGR
jgi:hypothetical protein